MDRRTENLAFPVCITSFHDHSIEVVQENRLFRFRYYKLDEPPSDSSHLYESVDLAIKAAKIYLRRSAAIYQLGDWLEDELEKGDVNGTEYFSVLDSLFI